MNASVHGGKAGRGLGSEVLEPLLLVVGLQGLDQLVKITLDDPFEAVQVEVDPVVGDAVLREAIRADSLGSAATACRGLPPPRRTTCLTKKRPPRGGRPKNQITQATRSQWLPANAPSGGRLVSSTTIKHPRDHSSRHSNWVVVQ